MTGPSRAGRGHGGGAGPVVHEQAQHVTVFLDRAAQPGGRRLTTRHRPGRARSGHPRWQGGEGPWAGGELLVAHEEMERVKAAYPSWNVPTSTTLTQRPPRFS